MLGLETLWKTCTSRVKYCLTSNYIQWQGANIVYLDYLFFFQIYELPYYSTFQMPLCKTEQVCLPAKIFDIFQSIYTMPEKILQNFIKIYTPFDKNLNVLVAYIASNCNSQNNHDNYIKKLMQYITVHSFKKCFYNQKVPNDLRDKYNLEKDNTAH
ncbi:43568_t:CDS:2 [Gigaspora margarita]|uniref:Fucosyltransferase n=1 Tax=Gigaspora margarita TaxID=4874 RepID=A0ABN7UVC3_GIGMA|nr:43568_t:CDS:2 [Gigaspora margarita]